MALAPTPSRPGVPWRPRQPRWRGWAAVAGAAVVAAAVLPPVLGLARRYVVAESAQFAAFALAGPALLAAGAPWWLARLPLARRALVSLAAARRRHPPLLRAGAVLAAFMAVSVAWRLPPVVTALAAHPALVAAELLSLLAAGTALWIELVPSPPLAPRLNDPQRAAMAALAMWSVWAAAYVLGLSNGAVFRSYDPPASALSPVADQELAVALVWAAAGICFVPVVFVTLLAWLRHGDDPDDELRRVSGRGGGRPAVRGWGRTSRGSGLPS
jgi:cytochrome c oxidase assembly factor CtaG